MSSIEATIAESLATTYRARVYITSDTLHLLCTSPEDAGRYYYRSTASSSEDSDSLAQAFQMIPEVAYGYRQLTVYVDGGSRYVLVPHELTAQPQDIGHWLPTATEGASVLSDVLPDLRASISWSIPQPTHEYCMRSFIVSSLSHPLRPTIESTLQRSRTTSIRTMSVVMSPRHHYFDVVLCAEGQLLLANRYRYKSAIDLLYYITALWRSHDYDLQQDSLYLFDPDRTAVSTEVLGMLQPSIQHLDLNVYSTPTAASIFQEQQGIPPYLLHDIEYAHH